MSLVPSICLSFDSQTSVNERLTRVVCLSNSLYAYVYPHICIHRARSYDVDFRILS